VNLFTVAEDSPASLVLENRGARFFIGASVLSVAGILVFSPLGGQKVHLGASDVTLPAQFLLGAFLLGGVAGALDRQRIVFDAGRGTVEFTSRMRPWARWRRPLADIAAVEASEHEETYYSSSPGSVATVTHHLHLRFRDGFRREVNRSGDRAFIQDLAARIERRRRGESPLRSS
jgi:hypothetical protein